MGCTIFLPETYSWIVTSQSALSSVTAVLLSGPANASFPVTLNATALASAGSIYLSVTPPALTAAGLYTIQISAVAADNGFVYSRQAQLEIDPKILAPALLLPASGALLGPAVSFLWQKTDSYGPVAIIMIHNNVCDFKKNTIKKRIFFLYYSCFLNIFFGIECLGSLPAK